VRNANYFAGHYINVLYPTEMSRRRKKRRFINDIVSQRIDRLFDIASSDFAADSARSDRYVAHARRLAMRYRVRLGKTHKMQFCRNCGAYFVYGINARVRVKNKRTVITCLRCNDVRRY